MQDRTIVKVLQLKHKQFSVSTEKPNISYTVKEVSVDEVEILLLFKDHFYLILCFKSLRYHVFYTVIKKSALKNKPLMNTNLFLKL